jgi:hypothetical protein
MTRKQTPTTADANARADTGTRRWSPSQQSELSALQSGAWWPFQRADPQVLAYLHRQAKKPNNLSDYEDALL